MTGLLGICGYSGLLPELPIVCTVRPDLIYCNDWLYEQLKIPDFAVQYLTATAEDREPLGEEECKEKS